MQGRAGEGREATVRGVQQGGQAREIRVCLLRGRPGLQVVSCGSGYDPQHQSLDGLTPIMSKSHPTTAPLHVSLPMHRIHHACISHAPHPAILTVHHIQSPDTAPVPTPPQTTLCPHFSGPYSSPNALSLVCHLSCSFPRQSFPLPQLLAANLNASCAPHAVILLSSCLPPPLTRPLLSRAAPCSTMKQQAQLKRQQRQSEKRCGPTYTHRH